LIISRSVLLRIKNFQTKVVEKLETRILSSIAPYNWAVSVYGISRSVGEHTKVPCSGYTLCLCGPQAYLCLHRLLVVRTGKFFPKSRSRTSSGTTVTPRLFSVRKCDLHLLFISRPTVSCLTRASRNDSWSR